VKKVILLFVIALISVVALSATLWATPFISTNATVTAPRDFAAPFTYEVTIPDLQGTPMAVQLHVDSVVTPTPIPTMTPTPTPGPTVFNCTAVVGYSQTLSWFRGNHITRANPGTWRYRADTFGRFENGASVEKWADPNFIGWLNPDQFYNDMTGDGCDSLADADRVVFSISGAARPAWEPDIEAALPPLRQHYPNALISLSSVVGGPNGTLCPAPEGGNVRATENYPAITTAIMNVAGNHTDVAVGWLGQVEDCGWFADQLGHINYPANGPGREELAIMSLVFYGMN